MKRNGQKYLAVYVDPDLAQEVTNRAEADDLSVSAVIRLALEAYCGGRSRHDAAFNEGLNKGLAEAKATIAKALNSKWR